VVELSARVRRRVPIAGTAVLPACILLVAAVPAASAVSWNVQQARITTTDQAARWLSRHAGNGEPVVIEDTVARLPPRMKTSQVRELIEKTADQYRQEGVVYLVASSRQFDQYSADPVRRAGDLAALATLFSQTDTAAVFTPSPEHPGPGLRILQIRR
jgi:hypothetical protein